MPKNDDSSPAFGFLLQAIGVLLMAISGLCTGAVIYAMLFGRLHGNFQKEGPGILAIGGVPFLIGLGLFKLGGRMRR